MSREPTGTHPGRGTCATWSAGPDNLQSWRRVTPTGTACDCTWSPARAARARPPWPAPWPWPLAADGKKVLLIEVEGRQGIAQLFDVPPLPYAERRIAVGLGTSAHQGGDVFALVADPESALIEYLEMFYSLRHAGTALAKLGVMDFATTIAPGLRDVLLTGKAAEAVRRKDDKRGRVYDAVVMDAPPTGRIGRFLNVTSEVSDLARVGPIRGHADTVQKVIRSPETVVHFVTVLEEMPVQETLDGIAELPDARRDQGRRHHREHDQAAGAAAGQLQGGGRRRHRSGAAGAGAEVGRPRRHRRPRRRAGRGAVRAGQDRRWARSSSSSGSTRPGSRATSCPG